MKTWQRSLAIGLWFIGIPALWSGWKSYNEAQQRQYNAAPIKRLEDAMERYQNQKRHQNTGPDQDQTNALVTPSTNDTEEQPQQEQTQPEPAQPENAQAATAQTTAQQRTSEFFQSQLSKAQDDSHRTVLNSINSCSGERDGEYWNCLDQDRISNGYNCYSSRDMGTNYCQQKAAQNQQQVLDAKKKQDERDQARRDQEQRDAERREQNARNKW